MNANIKKTLFFYLNNYQKNCTERLHDYIYKII